MAFVNVFARDAKKRQQENAAVATNEFTYEIFDDGFVSDIFFPCHSAITSSHLAPLVSGI